MSKGTTHGAGLTQRAVLATIALLIAPPVRIAKPAAADRCAAKQVDQSLGPSRSLYCIDLIPVPDFRGVHGTVALRRARNSPFTVAVDADGHHEYQLDITLRNLPDPRSLGPFTTYVAWATPPGLSPEVKLGEVRAGTTRVGVVSFNKFIVMITAERSGAVSTRSGRMLLRATSPSWLLQPHDASRLPAQSLAMAHTHSHDDADAGTWIMPAMHPQVPSMVAGLEAMVPNATPWRPGTPAIDTSSAGAPPVRPREIVALRDGDSLDLTAGLVRRSIAGREITTYGFNGQSPGPLIRVTQRSTIVINFTNHLDQPSSVHWHGIRLDNRFDGVPHVTQELVPPGGHFRYVIRFPDAGIYWYHPHHREDAQQDLGLYGNLFVQSPRTDYFAPVNREEVLMLDDFLLDGSGAPMPYGADASTHALMGRFGNVLLVNGSPEYSLHVARGDVVRFYLTNASNTRVFNVSIPGARMKLVAGDVGKLEREIWVESVVLAPAERYVVEARFDSTGTMPLVNHVQAIDHFRGEFFDDVDTLGTVSVSSSATPDFATSFSRLRMNDDVRHDIDRYRSRFAAPPDRTLLLTLDVSARLPFPLVQALRLDTGYVNPVEWSGTMPMMDWLPTSRDIRWVLRDPSSKRENMDVAWRFHVGDVVRLRLVNDRHTLHPMAHPIHLHGQRFLVLAVNGDSMQNLLWKDTVLVPAGSTVDLLVEMTNPGRWMLHCHIAEHLESGMHTVFEVVR
jgi:FtsP/CotA-like multicopper oxidase with cupredoxin domain